ncbi:MAG: hypothetical protein U9Q39_05000 [Pseudomonadota bacterium]|nr:hypothetical protein [Pseudomonadota bacterium]
MRTLLDILQSIGGQTDIGAIEIPLGPGGIAADFERAGGNDFIKKKGQVRFTTGPNENCFFSCLITGEFGPNF